MMRGIGQALLPAMGLTGLVLLIGGLGMGRDAYVVAGAVLIGATAIAIAMPADRK